MALKFEGGKIGKVYSSQLNNLARVASNAIISGCGVSATSPATMDVEIDVGEFFFGSTTTELIATQTVTISSNTSSYTRIDLIALNSSGVASVIEGTPSSLPVPADYDPDSYIILAQLTITSLISTVSSSNIEDLRIFNIGGGSGGSSSTGTGSFLKHTEEFTNQTTLTINHNLGDDKPIVNVFNELKEKIYPDITIVDENSIIIDFADSSSGFVIIYAGAGVNNAYYLEEFNSDTWVVEHNLNNKFVIAKCYDSTDKEIEPTEIQIVNSNQLTVLWGSTVQGTVVVVGGVSTTGLPIKYSTGSELRYIGASDTISVVDLSLVSKKYKYEIKNTGTDTVYFEFNNAATTDSFPILSGAKITIEDINFDTISFICASGETSNINLAVFSSQITGRKTNYEILKLNATTVTSTDSFSSSAIKDLLIINEGVNDCHISFDTTATTSNLLLETEDVLSLNSSLNVNFAAITSTGTSTIKILGVY